MLVMSFFSCKKAIEPTEEQTDLVVEIVDEAGNPLPSTATISVYLFENATAWNNYVTNGDASGAVDILSISDSRVAFPDLKNDVSYYFAARFPDDGRGYDISNYTSNFFLKNNLEEGATTTIVIQLFPYQTKVVAFYSLNGNLQNTAISIYYQGNLVDVLTQVTSTKPTDASDPAVVTIPVDENENQISWQAKGDNGCLWTGLTNVDDGFEWVEIEDCTNGNYLFWTTPANLAAAGGSILVVLNNTDTVGTITTGRATAPSSCTDSGVLRANRPMGSYLYHARGNTDCFWDGNVTIGNASCTDNEEISGCD